MHRLLSLCLVLFLAQTQAEPVDLKLGLASLHMNIGHAAPKLPQADTGLALFAEAPQSNYAATRLLLYRLFDQSNVRGGETQLLWGYGLAQAGPRLYLGPTWHFEKIQVQRAQGSRSKDFYGWGAQAGLGFQYQSLSLDYALGLRDNRQYRHENRHFGLKAGEVWTHSLLFSYHF